MTDSQLSRAIVQLATDLNEALTEANQRALRMDVVLDCPIKGTNHVVILEGHITVHDCIPIR